MSTPQLLHLHITLLMTAVRSHFSNVSAVVREHSNTNPPMTNSLRPFARTSPSAAASTGYAFAFGQR